MFKAFEKAAKKAEEAAKKVTETEQFQKMNTTIKAKTKEFSEIKQVKNVTTQVNKVTDKVLDQAWEIAESEPVQNLGEQILIAKEEKFDPLAKKILKPKRKGGGSKTSSHGSSHSSNTKPPRSPRPVDNVAFQQSIGDMSAITWSDGSVGSLRSLKVYGKDAKIDPSISPKKDIIILPTGMVIEEETSEDVARSCDEDEENPSSLSKPSSKSGEQEEPSATTPKVNLPILLFPGIASSGLYVEESGLHEKYKGRRVWMNANFMAASAMNNKIVNSDKIDEPPAANSPYINNSDTTPAIAGAPYIESIAEGTVASMGLPSDIEVDGEESSGEQQNQDRAAAIEFAKVEEEHAIRSAWLYHVSLDNNLVDERPGNKVRTYNGIKACEYLVDKGVTQTAAGVWADTLGFLEFRLGYQRGKNVAAAPYDWRLPPNHTEVRDGYLTNTIYKVEKLYKNSGGLPVVLCCHSMGCKMGHYFLNFCLQHKGQEWIDQHIHSYMPVGAPHTGAHLTVKLGATGAGLVGFLDNFMLSDDEGLIMYRSWGSGPWLMPRNIPKGVFPPAIVRREGELGIKIASKINLGTLFDDRDKLPKELRLTIIFRKKIRIHTEFQKIAVDESTNPPTRSLQFDETHYLAVPYLEDEGNLGNLVFYLEEPSGRLYENNQSEFRKQFREHTKWARSLKKGFTALYRSVAKKSGIILRVAVCEKPLVVKESLFYDSSVSSVGGTSVIEKVVPFCKCSGTSDANKILHQYRYEDDTSESQFDDTYHDMDMDDDGRSYITNKPDQQQSIGNLSILLSYTPPPTFSRENPECNTMFGVVPEDTPTPPVKSRRRKYNTIDHEDIVYDVWNARDLLYKDGFCSNMLDLYQEYYEQDPLGPTTKSAFDAPPVKIVRAIYGINVPTEISVVYRKVPVVTVGDNVADCRYMVDHSATFPTAEVLGPRTPAEEKAMAMIEGYSMKDGIINETPQTLQDVPGSDKQKMCCGDGTVPYWSLVHCLNWTDQIPEVTVDELEGAVHRSTISDKRFHALLQKYCTIDEPTWYIPPEEGRDFIYTKGNDK